jgi:hypothetical protein
MMAKVKKSQSHVDAKHEKHVKALLGKASKGSVALSTKKAAAAKGVSSAGGACTITFGGGFKVCRDNVTKDACNQVAKLMGGTPSFVPGGTCK